MIRRARILPCGEDVESCQVVHEGLSKLVSEWLQFDTVSLHALDDLVVHVSQVADVIHVVSGIAEPAFQKIVSQERTEVANVCEIVYGWSTSVH